MVCDLVQDDVPNPLAKAVGVCPVEPFEGAAEDGDLVGKRAGVAASSSQRHALVEAEERRAARWLVLDHDRDVRHGASQVGRQRIESVLDGLLEIDVRSLTTALDHGTSVVVQNV